MSSSEADITDLQESMRDDIEKLLNTRRGTVLVDEDFGLPDFTHLMNGYAAPDLEAIERDVLQQIKQYETRLSMVSLSLRESRGKTATIEFGLNARFQHRDQAQDFVATVNFADNGSIGVSL